MRRAIFFWSCLMTLVLLVVTAVYLRELDAGLLFAAAGVPGAEPSRATADASSSTLTQPGGASGPA